jgi:hypothetical protein
MLNGSEKEGVGGKVGNEAALPIAGGRVVSVDALRGLTILLMVFVNDLGPGAPAWMHHIQPSNADGMTLARRGLFIPPRGGAGRHAALAAWRRSPLSLTISAIVRMERSAHNRKCRFA